MNNLHKIVPIFTEKQLAHLWYAQRATQRVRIINGVVEHTSAHFQDIWNSNWWISENSNRYIMSVWKNYGKPIPDFSKIEHE